MLQEFKNHITSNLSFLLRGKVLVACSGGVDSIVLTRLCQELHMNIGVAHCNFGLRGDESNRDQKFVSELAEELDIPFLVKHFDTNTYAKNHGLSIQLAARELRYEWFEELAKLHSIDFILTGHHTDDNLETFLINLSRGTGIDGLTGIPEINDVFVRPLLPFTREQILNYATSNSIEWREDSSNSSTKYLRNKLRHEVIPQLKLVNPQFLQNFNKTLSHLNQSSDFISSQTFVIKKELFEVLENNTIRIPINRVRDFGNPRACLYYLLRDYGFRAWDDIEQIITAQSGKQIFSETHRLIKDRECLLLTELTAEVSDCSYTVPEEENIVMIPSGTLKFKEVTEMSQTDLTTVYVDKRKLKYPLIVRKWQEGDYFYPLGMKGKKKLSKYFKDEKLSLLAKERVWLLCSGKEIVWIINYRADNRYKITPQTEELLKITIHR